MLSRCPNRWLDFCHEALAAFEHGEHGPRTSAHQEGANVLPLGPYERDRVRNADAKCPRWLHLDKTNRRARAKRRASKASMPWKGGNAVPGPKVDALPTDPGPDRTYKRAISRLLARLCSRSCVQRSARLARGPQSTTFMRSIAGTWRGGARLRASTWARCGRRRWEASPVIM